MLTGSSLCIVLKRHRYTMKCSPAATGGCFLASSTRPAKLFWRPAAWEGACEGPRRSRGNCVALGSSPSGFELGGGYSPSSSTLPA